MSINAPLSVRIESPAFSSTTPQIYELDGVEAIGKLFEFRLEVACPVDAHVDEEKLLSEPVELVFSRNYDEQRRVFGILRTVTDRLHSEGAHIVYSLRVVPRVFGMSLNKTSSVFVDTSVPDIVKKKLTDASFTFGKDFELRLRATYAKRDFVLQYEETDLAFISRLVEHLGISLFFEHKDGRDVLVFSDHNSAFQPIDGDAIVSFFARGDATGVFALEGTTHTIPARYVLKDYNYRTPNVELVAQATVSAAGQGSVVEYGAHFRTKEEGDALAKIRAEELRATRRVYDGKSDVQTLRAGATFTIDGHPRVEEELLLIEVRHRATQGVFGTGTGSERSYTNEFRAIPAKATFRPARVTEKPRVHGAISGLVEAAGSEKYAELDEYGRYHVRLMLDQGEAPKGSASSLLRMAQPHAGPGYGFHFPLRAGVEVMLTFIDGDPDRPIITGAVPNAVTPSTVSGKNGMRNVIRTGGGTEINIDDNESGTRFKVTTPHQNTVFQLGAPNAPVEGIFMGTDKAAQMSSGDTVKIDAGVKFDIIAGANLNLAAPDIDIAGASKIYAHAPAVEVGGDASVFIHADKIDETAGTRVRIGAPTVLITGVAGFTATSQGILIIASGHLVNITAGTAVTVKAPCVNVEGSGSVNIKGGKINLNS